MLANRSTAKHSAAQRPAEARRAKVGEARTAKAAGVGAPAGRLTSCAAGMQELVGAAAARLGAAVRTGARVSELKVRRGFSDGPRLVGARAFSLACGTHAVEADAVVLAGP